MTLLDLLLAIAALPLWGICAYLLALTLLSGHLPTPGASKRALRFDVLVPSHNEEGGIARTVEDLRAIDWPEDRFRVVVIADNCSDETARRARAAGALVLERHNADLRGKGYALEFAFENRLAEGDADAFVVVDADTVVSKNLLEAFATRLESGAQALQADYAVQNRDASWRTRLMAIALGMFHILRSLARERLGVSVGLRGNGMCFSRQTLERVPHRAFSLVEDLEYGIRLAEAGIRVTYAQEAHVYGEMVSGEKASRSQRLRWEGGRAKMRKLWGWPLLARALKERSLLYFDLAMDVLVPPLATVGVLVVGTTLLVAALAFFGLAAPILAALCAFAVAALGAYVLRGWWLSGAGARGLLDLAFAPAYVAWKIVLKLRKPAQKRDEWVRTAREGNPP